MWRFGDPATDPWWPTRGFRLAVQYLKLATNPPTDAAVRFELLDAINQARIEADVEQGDAENHSGTRLAL